MLHSDLFPAFGCDGELIELPERSTKIITVRCCEKCETELIWAAGDEPRVWKALRQGDGARTKAA